LPLVLEIIHYFQGALQFESFPGKGTTFHLFLPANITTQKSQFQRESDMVFNNNFSGKTVLLIEDNKTLLTSLTFLLEEAGCEVFTAKDGQEAVDLFVEHQDALELIILDMNLPVIHGADVFRQIKERKPEMKIIISSSYNMQDINHFLGGPDLAPVLRKPYEIKTLLQKLEFIFAE